MKIILLNGPRNSGKDTIASRFLAHTVPNSAVIKPVFHPTKVAALAEYELPAEAVDEIEAHGLKDDVMEKLGNKSPRQVYIEYGNAQRALHGPDVFTDKWLADCASNVDPKQTQYMVVPDIRFQPEVNAACKLNGNKNVVLIYVNRDGTSWKGDIGSYLDHDWAFTLINNYDVADLGAAMLRLVQKWEAQS